MVFRAVKHFSNGKTTQEILFNTEVKKLIIIRHFKFCLKKQIPSYTSKKSRGSCFDNGNNLVLLNPWGEVKLR